MWFTGYAMLRLLIDDVPKFVTTQMKRQEFIDSKIIDQARGAGAFFYPRRGAAARLL